MGTEYIAGRPISRPWQIGVKGTKQILMGLVIAAGVMLTQPVMAAGPTPVDLGSAGHFTILSGAAITTTGGGTIYGDVGASPIAGSAIGVTAAQVNGTIYAVDNTGPVGSVVDPILVGQAKGALTTAYQDAAARTPVPTGAFLNPNGGNIGGLTLVPGLYKFTSQALITGADVTLAGGPSDVWIFQIGTALTVGATGIHVILFGGAQAQNVFWQVGSSATLGTSCDFKGTIMAYQSITMDTGSTMEGRALASIGAVTFNANLATNQVTLTTSSTAGGAVSTPGEGSFTYNYGKLVAVAATADLHYHFVNWTGTAVDANKVADSSSASTTVTMEGNYTLVANFAIDQVTLITSSTAGGAVSTPGEGSFTYNRGTSVAVAATADPHYHFVKWTGTAVTAGKVAAPTAAGTTVTMDDNYTLVANFAIDQVTLIVSSTKGGTAQQPGLGTFTYDYGTVVTLYAVPEPGYVWAGWSGSVFSSAVLYSLTMTSDYQVRANFTSLLCPLYVDDNAPADPGPYDDTVSDPLENGSVGHPFDSIQEAIDVVGEGCVVIVREGTYREHIDFLGKTITVTGFDANTPQPSSYPIIDGAGFGPVVKIVTCWCSPCEDPNSASTASESPQSVLMGLVITGGNGYDASAIFCRSSSPLISNCVIAGNRSRGVHSGAVLCEYSNPVLVNCTITENVAGDEGAAICGIKSCPVLVNSIVWDNVPRQMTFDAKSLPVVSYMDVQGGWPGTGNLDVDPLFGLPGYWADPSNLSQPVDPRVGTAVWVPGDFHLMSKVGRWDFAHGIWVQDLVTSPCIDAGDPASPVGQEPQPNGNRVNLGAYGGTSQASLSGN